MRRLRELATETAGFYNTSGFVDDEDEAVRTAVDLARTLPKQSSARSSNQSPATNA